MLLFLHGMVPIIDDLIRAALPAIDSVTVVGIAIGTAKTFEWFDGMLSDQGRDALADWLRNAANSGASAQWATVFPSLIDRVFGDHALSWKFFARSCVSSAFAVSLCAVFFLRLRHLPLARSQFEPIFLVGVIANFLPDHISLLVSRFMVQLMARRPGAWSVAALLAADTVLTTMIALFSVYLSFAAQFILIAFCSLVLFHHLIHLPLPRILSLGALGIVSGRLISHGGESAIYFYSAFFTSMWVWIYILAGWSIKGLSALRSIWAWLLPNMDLRKPMVVMGRVAGVLLGICWACVLVAQWVGKHLQL